MQILIIEEFDSVQRKIREFNDSLTVSYNKSLNSKKPQKSSQNLFKIHRKIQIKLKML